MNRPFLAAAVLAALAALLFFGPHEPAGPPMRDFEAYYAAGAAANAGADPYGISLWTFERPLDPSHPSFALLPFVSPPFVVPVLRAVALLPFAAANVLWRIVLLGCIGALACAALRCCGSRLRLLPILCAGALATGFGPLTSAFALGQLALPAYAAAACAFEWPPAAIAAWLQPNLALTLFSRPPRMVLVWTLAGALIFAIPLSAAYVQTLATHTLSERFSAIQMTPESILYGFGLSPQAAAAGGLLVAAAAFALWLIDMRTTASALTRFAAGCALLPLGMPFFHEHDFIVTFVPAVLVAVLCPARLWPLAIVAALLCAVDWLGMAQRPGGIAQSALLAMAFFCAAAALRTDLRARHVMTGALLAAAFFVPAALLGAHDVLPVWPAAMHPLGAHAFTSAAQAWYAEQDATGLFAPNAGWSALRTLPLGGSLLLALLLTRHVDVHHVVERRDAVGMEVA